MSVAAPPGASLIATVDHPLRTMSLSPSPATAAASSTCHRLVAKTSTATTAFRPLPTLAQLHHRSKSSIAINAARPSPSTPHVHHHRRRTSVVHAPTASIVVASISSSTSPVNRMPTATCIHVGTMVNVDHQCGTNTAMPRR
ncbi:hypothetical protein ACLOJK_023838 [Asimina triloba]